ncbi:MAG: peptidase domain-containing ABC transporter [Duganella sp.]
MHIDKNLHLNLRSGSRLPLLLQSEASECGLACLAMIASYHGYQTDISELRKQFTVSLKGVTLDQLIVIADGLGLTSRPLRLELDEIASLQMPCILHWDINHFVVLKSVRNHIAVLHDPAVGELRCTLAALSDHFTGVALELAPDFAFRRKAPAPGLQLGHLIGKVVGLKRGLLQVLVLAVGLETIALLLPMLNQWITDEALVSGAHELLTLLCMGIVALGLTQAVIAALRTWIGMYISTSFSLQWMSNVMTHMLRLPIDFFERRHVGDIVNRFNSVRTIERMLTSGMVDALLDGLLALGTLVMMYVYSPALASVTLLAVLLYVGLRWGRYNAVRLANQGLIARQALEQTYFLETVRGVRSIKLFNREHGRRASWVNRLVSVTNADLALQKLNLSFSAAWSLLSSVERGAILWMGAAAVIDNRMTLGMLFAFLSYKEQFSSRLNSLVDRLVDFKMLSIQTERLADIVLAAPEEKPGMLTQDVPDDLTLALDKVSFRYSASEPPVLLNASLAIAPGTCVAIVGASGQGKTTMMKLMLGILKPGTGQVTLGGLPLQKIGMRKYRDVIATVMQDDHLYAGTLYDNICFFDARPDRAWLERCAQLANVHAEIIDMPMGYHTLVGDMGTVLSGGQQQRVLLARALYKRPRILFLDEATSHLDLGNEAAIAESLAALDITRIMIAHRPQTIAIADRVIRVENGRMLEDLRRRPVAAVPAGPELDHAL